MTILILKISNLACNLCFDKLISGIPMNCTEEKSTFTELRCLNCKNIMYIQCNECMCKCIYLDDFLSKNEYISGYKLCCNCDLLCYLNIFGENGGEPVYFKCTKCDKKYEVNDK